MTIRVIAASILALTSCVTFADIGPANESAAFTGSDFIVADTRGQDRREDRGDDRGDRKDCRKEEGRVGRDKRDCKQDNRGEGEGDDDA
jgi:hypothetical protein